MGTPPLHDNRAVTAKVGAGFGWVGLLFLGTVALHQTTLTDTLATLQETILEQTEGETANARHLQALMQAVREDERDFLRHKDSRQVEAVKEQLTALQQRVEGMLQTPSDDATNRLYTTIKQSTEAYRTAFLQVVQNETEKGLQPGAGLQGAFQASTEAMEQAIRPYSAEEVPLSLLQMRQTEQTYLLSKELKYAALLEKHFRKTVEAVGASPLADPVKQELLTHLQHYWTAFKGFLHRSLESATASPDPFRDIALEMETRLKSQHVPGLARIPLALRLHEQAFRLYREESQRGGLRKQLTELRQVVTTSAIADAAKTALMEAAESYHTAFLALLAQEKAIDSSLETMRTAAQSLDTAIETLLQVSIEKRRNAASAAHATARKQAHLALGASGVLFLLGLLIGWRARQATARGRALDPLPERRAPLRPSSVTITATAPPLVETTQELARAITQQAAEGAKTAAALGQLLSRMQQYGTETQAVASLSQAAVAEAMALEQGILQMGATLGEIARKMALLEESGVNPQALQAAVEAAWTGKRGKKLAVVIDEVHKQRITGQAATGEVGALAAAGVAAAEQAGTLLTRLLADLQTTAARLQAITTAYQEQIREIGALNQTIQQRGNDITT